MSVTSTNAKSSLSQQVSSVPTQLPKPPSTPSPPGPSVQPYTIQDPCSLETNRKLSILKMFPSPTKAFCKVIGDSKRSSPFIFGRSRTSQPQPPKFTFLNSLNSPSKYPRNETRSHTTTENPVGTTKRNKGTEHPFTKAEGKSEGIQKQPKSSREPALLKSVQLARHDTWCTMMIQQEIVQRLHVHLVTLFDAKATMERSLVDFLCPELLRFCPRRQRF